MTGPPCIAALAAALMLSACAPSSPPPSAIGETDPVLQGHSQWCNTNPPSGYCDVDDHR